MGPLLSSSALSKVAKLQSLNAPGSFDEMTVKNHHFVTETLAEPVSGVLSLSVAVTVMV
jgi:hypothetical protein